VYQKTTNKKNTSTEGVLVSVKQEKHCLLLSADKKAVGATFTAFFLQLFEDIETLGGSNRETHCFFVF